MKEASPVVAIEVRNGYLVVTGKGSYDEVADLSATTERVYVRVVEDNIRHILLDFREAHFSLPLAEAFNLVRRYELSMPAFLGVVAAAVFNRHSKEFTDYWQEIGLQRGYDISLFKTLDEAEHWLIARLAHKK